MNPQVTVEKCAPFLSSELQGTNRPALSSVTSSRNGASTLAITLSRQTGSGAHTIAHKLADYLHAHSPAGSPQWRIFDRNLVETALEQHHLPHRMSRYIPEDRTSPMAEVMDELLGVHPPTATLLRQIDNTILNLARQGNVILIGRGANIITRSLDNVLHVRLVAPLPQRIAHVQHLRGIERQDAVNVVRKEDRGRWRYLKQHFDRNLDDPLLYHLTINTHLVSHDKAAIMIGEVALHRLYSPAQTRE